MRLRISGVTALAIRRNRETRASELSGVTHRQHGAAVAFARDEYYRSRVRSLQAVTMRERGFRGRFAGKAFANDRAAVGNDLFFERAVLGRIGYTQSRSDIRDGRNASVQGAAMGRSVDSK